jgi:hypothetical protein
MKPGRNDPCPCGSGKKYKNCCLVAERERRETPDELAWRRVRRAIGGVPQLLWEFVAEVYSPEALEEAWDEFTVWDGPAFDPESPLVALFMPWMYHGWEPDPHIESSAVPKLLHDRPPTRVFLERRGGRLDPLLERYLQACLEAPFSFHEILRCDPGRGFRTRDVLTGDEHEVREATASQSMSVGDVVFGQLVPIEGIVILEACSPYVLSPADKIAIIELREQREAAIKKRPDAGNSLRDWDIEIRELYLALIRHVLDPRPPVLHNTDGELVKLQRITFELADMEQALAALERFKPEAADVEVVRAPDGRLERARLPWLEPGNRMHANWENTVLGHVEIAGGRLVAHVNSDERAVKLRDALAQALGDAGRYRGTEAIDPADLDAELEGAADANDAAAEDLAADPAVRAHLSRMMEQHYDDWASQELPALGGRKPIDVVNEPHGREKLEALVTDMERRAARTQPGIADAAFKRLRERLGLPRSVAIVDHQSQ